MQNRWVLPGTSASALSSFFMCFAFCILSLRVIMWSMTKKQRESTAKYLYDISKGIALLAVIGNLVQGKWELPSIFLGIATSILFFIGAYILEGGKNNE